VSGRLVPLARQGLKITVSIGAVKLVIPIETSLASTRPRVRTGNGQFAAPSTLLDATPVATPVATFDVVLVEAGDHKIEVIKEIRNFLGLGLMEAKTLVNDAPSIVKENVSRADAEVIEAALESVGATAVLQPFRWRGNGHGNGQYVPQHAEAGHGA
jgi:large subunit ribosomal protein L7/L12